MNYNFLVTMLLFVVNTHCCASEKQLKNEGKNTAAKNRELFLAGIIAKQHKQDEFSYFAIQPKEFLYNLHKFKTKSTH